METRITFQVVNGNIGFEERDIEFHKLEIAKQYAIRNGFTHIHEYHGGYFKMAYDVEMMNRDSDLIYIRTMQHDTEDNIRIGVSYPVDDLFKAEQEIIKEYEKDTAWCGGFKAACEKYFKRIAIVRADTLEVIRSIYERKEANNED